MEKYDICYEFEHRILPQLFFNDQVGFIGVLLKDKDVLFKMIDEMFMKEKVTNPYNKDDFNIDAARITDTVYMLKIIFPEPEKEPLCYCSYIFFDEEFEKTEYYCIEKGGEHSKFLPFVCSWTSDRTHHNYGCCGTDEDEDFLKCADLYMKKNFNLSRE